MQIEKPTLLAAIAYIILGFVIMLPLNIGDLDPENKPYKFTNRLLLLLILLIPIAISLYSINCMLKGKCVVWSYVNSIFICSWIVVFILGAVLYNNK
jgi:hypothetical protein